MFQARSGSLALLWQRLTEPAAAVDSAEDRRRARLLAALQLILIPVTFVILLIWRAVEPVNAGIVGFIFVTAMVSVLVIYGLSRTRYYRWGAGLLVAMLLFLVPINVITTRPPYTNVAAASMDFLAVAVLCASVLLSIRQTALVALLSLIEVALLPFVLPDLLPITLFGRLTFLVLTSAFVITVAILRRRDQQYIERQARELAESEARYRQMFEKNQAIKLLIDPASGQIVDANPAACDFYGYSYAQMTALKISDINTLPEQSVREEMARALSEQRVYFLFQHRLSSGEARDVEVYSGPIETRGRKLLFSIIHDITERKRVEAALRESEQRFRATFEQAAVGIAQTSPDGRWLRFNQKLCEIVGYTREELSQCTWQDITYAGDLNADLEQALRLLSGDIQTYTMEKRYVRKDASLVWVNMTISLVRTSEGQPDYFIAVVEDISNRKRIEAALQETNRMLEASRDVLRRLIQQIPIGIQVFDASGLCTDVNQSHLDIFGVAHREQLIGRYNIFADPMAERVGTAAGAKRALAGEIVHLGDLPFDFTHADPRYAATSGQRTISVSFFPVLDEAGHIVNIVALNQDISERKHAEAQHLELAVERERVQMLQHFIRDTSHDLRTPLTTIKTSLYLLERTIDDPGKRERYIGVIQEQASRLHQQIEDLLSLSRLDKSSVEEFTFEMRSLSLLLQNVVAGQKSLAERKKHRLSLSVEANLPPILADDAQLFRALSNLLVNALNYTPDGGDINVQAYRRDDRIAVEIQDNGIGIRKEDLPHIFERFFRADATRSAETGGAGLGLTIARRVIEAHGGDIEVESEAGKGSTFRVWLPVVNP
jgi:PAS domain S-box-containing protein